MYRPRRLNHFSSNHLNKNTQCKTFENNKPTGVNKLRLRCMYNVLFMPPRNLYIFAQSGHINCMQILFLCFSKNFSLTYHLLWILLCRLCLCDLVLLAYLHKDHARINNQLYSNSLHVNMIISLSRIVFYAYVSLWCGWDMQLLDSFTSTSNCCPLETIAHMHSFINTVTHVHTHQSNR